MGESTLKKILIYAVLTVIVLGVGLFGYNYYMNYKAGKFQAEKNQKEIEAMVENINKEKDADSNDEDKETLKPSDYYPIQKIYDIMHRMANTKIIAEDNKVWGELPIDESSLRDLRELISEIDYEDREYLLNVISRWEEGDFSEADDEHNYFWTKLGGTVGRAIDVKK